jgi:hypothetical protein
MIAQPVMQPDGVFDADVVRVVDACKRLPAAEGVYLEEDFVTNMLATVVDFQMHTTAVVRAMEHFSTTCRSEIRTLDELDDVFAQFQDDKDGNIALAEHLWGYKLWTRAHMLRDLCAYFRSIGVCDEGTLKRWAQTSTFRDDFAGRVKGLGIAVYSWLVMRQGVETVKPDVHVRRFAEAVVGERLSDERVVALVTQAAQQLGLKAYELDWRIWEASRAGTL